MTTKTTFPFSQKRVLNINASEKPQTFTDEKLINLKLHITQRGTKTYYARFKIQGAQHNIRLGDAETIKLDDARARVIELINYERSNVGQFSSEKLNSGTAKSGFTVNDAFECYYVNHLSHKPKIGNRTHSFVSMYKKHLKSVLGQTDIAHLNRKSLAKLLKLLAHDVGPTVHNKCVSVLKATFNYCLDYEDTFPLEFNPAASLKKTSTPSRERYLTLPEVNRLLDSLKKLAHPIFSDLFSLTLFTGARIYNVKSMRWDEIDFETKTWIVPAIKTKTKRTYRIPLIKQSMSILETRRISVGDTPFVFPTPTKSSTGHVMGGDKVWKAVIIAAGLYSENREIRVCKHDLRRTFATWQALQGVDINTISQALGHTDIKNTQIYARINGQIVRDAITLGFSQLIDQKQ